MQEGPRFVMVRIVSEDQVKTSDFPVLVEGLSPLEIVREVSEASALVASWLCDVWGVERVYVGPMSKGVPLYYLPYGKIDNSSEPSRIE